MTQLTNAVSSEYHVGSLCLSFSNAYRSEKLLESHKSACKLVIVRRDLSGVKQ